MFDFLRSRKRGQARQFLLSRVNRSLAKGLRVGERDLSRSAVCEAVWLVPCDADGMNPEGNRAYAAVTRDISATGMSIIQNEPMTLEHFLVGFEESPCRTFVLCKVRHTTPLGSGFYHVGLCPDREVDVDPEDLRAIEACFADLQEPVGAI